MKFKSLFLTMLGAAVMFSCNNDSVINNPSGGGEEDGPEETTYATFFLKSGKGSGNTYAGTGEQDGTGRENYVGDAVLAIYKSATGQPEAIAYVNAVPQHTNGTTGSGGKVTLKCKTGAKKIFLAVNVGQPVTTAPTGTSSAILVYGNTDKTVDNTELAPGVQEQYEGVMGTLFADTLNALLVSTGANSFMNDFKNTALTSTAPTLPTASANANGLILGLTGAGNTNNGTLSGIGGSSSAYLMSNWDGNNDIAGSYINGATCKFNLKKVTAGVSRPASAGNADANAFTINVQRAVAKIALNVVPGAAEEAGSGTNSGEVDLTLSSNYAVGNLSKATYPFQQFDGSVVKSPAYDCSEGIATGTTPLSQFKRFMDNSRIYGAYDITQYPTIKTTVDATVLAISEAPNVAFTKKDVPDFNSANYTVVTENNNASALNAYSSYVLFAAVYKPDTIITGAPAGSVDASCPKLVDGAQPTYTTSGASTDTLYYVKDANFTLLQDGKFFWGFNTTTETTTLRDYMLNVLGIAAENIQAQLDEWNGVSGVEHAKMQKYYLGKCFYRIWVKDETTSTTSSDKFLVRRNHMYDINITKFDGPGIADPHSIIDPDPTTGPEELEESDTYVTATINVVPWHKVEQNGIGGLGN